jgi:hypothetical protein
MAFVPADSGDAVAKKMRRDAKRSGDLRQPASINSSRSVAVFRRRLKCRVEQFGQIGLRKSDLAQSRGDQLVGLPIGRFAHANHPVYPLLLPEIAPFCNQGT